ncbi:hypothetical protein [Epilithonimonas sp. UC225_85]|uniref:hypothetical protein n=1 Tax=Epilithonimonas sp. UC225_85 TaxID=3350167 RepID=UPI0036D3A54D
MDIFQKESLEAVHERFANFKMFVDNSSGIPKLYEMMEVIKSNLLSDLLVIHSPLNAPGQASETLQRYAQTDFVELFDSYGNLYIQTCKNYLKEVGKSNE